jgi:hypothetical protein
MDRLLNASITREKVVYGSDWTPQHEINLRQAFSDYQEKRSYMFCWIDTKQTLQARSGWPFWMAFIKKRWTPQHEIFLRQVFFVYQQERSYVFCWIDAVTPTLF